MSALAVVVIVAVVALGLRERRRRAEREWSDREWIIDPYPEWRGLPAEFPDADELWVGPLDGSSEVEVRWWFWADDGTVTWHDSPVRERRDDG